MKLFFYELRLYVVINLFMGQSVFTKCKKYFLHATHLLPIAKQPVCGDFSAEEYRSVDSAEEYHGDYSAEEYRGN